MCGATTAVTADRAVIVERTLNALQRQKAQENTDQIKSRPSKSPLTVTGSAGFLRTH
jgi:hypothetical protein